MPAARIAASMPMRAAVAKRSDRFRGPVALGESVDVAKRPNLAAVAADRVGHLPPAAKQAIDLARVQPDAGDLALELIRDVRVLRFERDVGRQRVERVWRQLVEPTEAPPPGVREVLVERHDSGVLRSRHHPLPTAPEQLQPHGPAELMVNVIAYAEWQA